MREIVRWFSTTHGAFVVLAALVIAVILRVALPQEARKKLSGPLYLGLLYGALQVPLRVVPLGQEARRFLEATTSGLGALIVTGVLFVLIVDIAIERIGRAPANQLVKDVIRTIVMLLVALGSLHVAGADPSSLIAGGTVVTVVVGLASQETLGNLAAGISIQLERPIQVGDWIRLDKSDFLGRVVQTNWRAVTIETDDRVLFVIPNSVFSKTPFSNFSRPESVAKRRSLYITIPYDVPPDRVHEAILSACDDAPEVLGNPAPTIFTWSYDANGLTYWLRYFISDFSRRDPIQHDVYTRIWYQLHRRKMSIAVPVAHHFLHKLDQRAKEAHMNEVLRDRRDAIDGVDFLRPLSDESKTLLVERGHRRLFMKGETVIKQGDVDRSFFIIRRGSVALTIGDREFTQLDAGDFFGEMALLTGRERRATVTTLEESELFEIDDHLFEEVLHREPAVASEMSRIVAERQSQMESRRTGAPPPTREDVQKWSSGVLAKLKEMFSLR